MEAARAALVAAVQQDPTAVSATKRYQFAQLCDQKSLPHSSLSSCEKDLKFAQGFCKNLDLDGSPVESDASMCEWWQQQALRSSQQAQHRHLAGHFLKHFMAEALESDLKALEDGSDIPCAGCPECDAAMQDNTQQLPEPRVFLPAPRKLRPVSLEALAKPVTTQEVKKALTHIAAHTSLSCNMRREASQILDRSSAITNFATAVQAMLESAGGLWQWGEAAAFPPHRHAVHGLKKCRVFSEPTTVLMMAFLEVFSGRLLSEVSKSLNTLQRWRHKQEVRNSIDAVRAALSCSQRSFRGQPLEARVENLQRMRLQLRKRFDFPLSQRFCYDGAGETFGQLFSGLRIELELCRACFCSVSCEHETVEKCDNESDNVSDLDEDSELVAHDFELVGENLTVLKADLRCCSNTMPHSLLLHCLKALGLGPDWLAFFKSYLEGPLPSANSSMHGMPLGPSLSTLLLEIVGCFLDLWLHTMFLQRSKMAKTKGLNPKVASEAVAPESPVLASFRCGDDIWLISRTAHVSDVWARFKDLYSDCGLVLNFEDSGSVTLTGATAEESCGLDDLQQHPCWSLLQLTPDCTWKVAGWALAPRISRALAEVQAQDLSMLQRIGIFNRHIDALLRQGGFHEELREGLNSLHLCISSLFQKAVENGTKAFKHSTSPLVPTVDAKTFGKLLSSLLWWPRQSGGLGARHLGIALHNECSVLVPLLPSECVSGKPLDTCVRSTLETSLSRNDHYESHLRALFGPLIQEVFGTSIVLDGRYAALLG